MTPEDILIENECHFIREMLKPIFEISPYIQVNAGELNQNFYYHHQKWMDIEQVEIIIRAMRSQYIRAALDKVRSDEAYERYRAQFGWKC